MAGVVVQSIGSGDVGLVPEVALARRASGRHAPGRGDLLLIGVFALALRVIVAGSAMLYHGISPRDYAHLYDGHSYLVVAKAMGGDASELNAYHARVFFGYPAMIAAAGALGVPLEYGAMAIDWLAAALAAALAGAVFGDRRIGWASACLVPHYLMNSTMSMTEAPLLALTLGGLVVLLRGREGGWQLVIGGILLGTAGLVRPVAAFAVMGWIVVMISRRRMSRALAGGAIALAVVVAGTAAMHVWSGDGLGGVKYQIRGPYGGQLLTWPFHSLLTTPSVRPMGMGRIIYMWMHVVVVFSACVAMGVEVIKRIRGRAGTVDASTAQRGLAFLALPWLALNTLFALSIGNVWGFECFHRFTVPAQPAMFFALRWILPGRLAWWLPMAAGSAVVAVLSINAGR